MSGQAIFGVMRQSQSKSEKYLSPSEGARKPQRENHQALAVKGEWYPHVEQSQTAAAAAAARTQTQVAAVRGKRVTTVPPSLLGRVVTARKRSCGKVMFLQVSVILFTGGGVGVLSQHALQVVSQHALQQVLGWGGWYPSMPCRFPGPYPRGKLRGSGQGKGVSRPTPKGEVEGDLVQAHSQGGNWGGSGPSPHPRWKLRGIWLGGGCLLWWGGACSGGCLLQGDASSRGGYLLPGCVCGDPRDGYCCGRYASYWNAFLFVTSLTAPTLFQCEIAEYIEDTFLALVYKDMKPSGSTFFCIREVVTWSNFLDNSFLCNIM